ncbi:hypothetical protein [Burkholderia sp. BCC1977]|uniref:hypothetical protein n=1 Tax=Burkholderia sp. BCC1977 TaxID=2817440 RepID=UPI002ABE03C1|nr:hypothetical protein [Burkholderia sp. BCC1977]
MGICVGAGIKRDIAETIGRYFDARGMAFHIEERPADVLYVGFRADGYSAAVTITFDEDAFAAFEQWNIEQKRLALKWIEVEFAVMIAQRSRTEYAGNFHIDRF